MAKEKKSYEILQKELEEITSKIQSYEGSGKLTELIELYEQSEKIITEMQEQLDTAKNTIKKIKP